MKMTKYQHDFKVGDVVVALGGLNFGHYEESQKGVITDTTSKAYPKVRFESDSGKTGWNGWPLLENIRKASPVEVAEYNLKKAQAALEAAKAAEKAAAEAKRKAEEEAKRFTEADVKNLMVVATDKEGKDLRLVVIPDEDLFESALRVRFYDVKGRQCNSCSHDNLLRELNSMYFKTNKTLKDFANEAV
jgi:hypothetical protein